MEASEQAAPQSEPTEVALPVVVELFTSEGCSSCPPADAVLRDLARLAREEGRAILPLSFHVDYWDYLGWKDPFSSPRYSARQRWYASIGGQRGVYTPQIVVAGQERMVGSKRARVMAAIEAHAGHRGRGSVGLDLSLGSGCTVGYAVEGLADEANLALRLALTRDQASNSVERGENAGQTLEHVQIVVDYASFDIGSAQQRGHWKCHRPSDGDVSVTGFVQSRDSGAILAATRADAQ
jgi:hypothetical protein